MSSDAALVPVVVQPNESDRFLPALSMDQAKQRYNAMVDFAQSVMKEGHDYGTIPGVNKPCLLKAGAEKLMTFFGLTVEDPDILTQVEDWSGDRHGGEPFFYYQIRQRVSRDGRLIASQIASCNSWETKFRYRWVKEADLPPDFDKSKCVTRDGTATEFAFAIDKAETSGSYGKPAEHWKRFKDEIEAGRATKSTKKTSTGRVMDTWTIGAALYRVPNDSIFDQVNTIQKMAEKRALVAATLIATNASEFYTQDMEDLPLIDVPGGHLFPDVGNKPAAGAGSTSAADFTKKADPPSDKPVGVKNHVGPVDDKPAEAPPAVKPLPKKKPEPEKQAAPPAEPEKKAVAAEDALAEWVEPVKAINALKDTPSSVAVFVRDVLPRIDEKIRKAVHKMVMARQLELESSIVACQKIKAMYPDLADAVTAAANRIRASRGANGN